MNKTIAFLILGVILLAMALIMVNQYTTQPQEPPNVGTPTVPQTPPSASLTLPAGDAALLPSGSSALQTAPGQMEPRPIQSAPAPEAALPPSAKPGIPQWASNLQEQKPLAASSTQGFSATPSPVAENRSAPTPSLTEATSTVPKAPQLKVEAPTPKAETAKTAPPKPKAETPKPKGPKTINKIAIFTADDSVTVRLDASEMPTYTTMQLKTPDRLVVDLQGEWNVRAPGVPANKFVSNVRIGKQKESTRIVIDLRAVPGSIRYLKKGTNGVDIRFK